MYYFVLSDSLVKGLTYLLFFLKVLDFGYILSTGNLPLFRKGRFNLNLKGR